MAENNTHERHTVTNHGEMDKKTFTFSLKSVVYIGVVVLTAIVFFALGSSYGKNHEVEEMNMGPNSSANNGATSPNGRPRRNFNIGTVKSISASSITVTNIRSGADTTFNITSSTTVSNNGSAAQVSDIQVGQPVLISPSTTSSTDAAKIMINPSFGSAPTPPSESNN